MTHLIIGFGEIGKAIEKVLLDGFRFVNHVDEADEELKGRYDVLHICFPPSPKFTYFVKLYTEKYLAPGGIVIIHSSTPIGTADECGAVHSPCRGIHPYLYEGLKTFVKFFGGEGADKAAQIFKKCGVPVQVAKSARDTEAMKLFDTTQYGLAIVAEKLIWRYCREKHLDFDLVYTAANQTYNDGYERLGHPEFKKYVLAQKDGKIGGHCVIQNCEILDDPLSRFILKENKKI